MHRLRSATRRCLGDCSVWLRCLVLLLVFGGSLREARAQATTADGRQAPPAVRGQSEEAQALRLGHAGLLAFRKERYTEAFSLFQEAESLVHSPVFLLYQGRAAVELGRLLQARRLLSRCAEEELTDQSPSAWGRARVEAEGELALVESRIPRLTIQLRGAFAPPLEVQSPTPELRPVQVTELDEPGALRVEADPGAQELTLRDSVGRVRVVIWEATPGPDAHALSTFLRELAPPPSPPIPSMAERPAPRSSALRRGAWTALAGGGALVVAGLVAGGVAVERATTLKRRCEGSACSPEDEQLKFDALTAARLASAGVVAGSVALLGSGALFLLDARRSGRWSVGVQTNAVRLNYAF